MTQWITEVPASDSQRSESLLSSRTASFDLDAVDLLQNELEAARDSGITAVFWSARTLVNTEGEATSWGSGRELTGSVTTDLLMLRMIQRITELADRLLDSAVEANQEPTPDPQVVRAGWRSHLHEVGSRESDDIYQWYASLDDEA
jgi:hypothetical protein